MFEIIGTFIDKVIFILIGIILLIQSKRFEKKYLKWMAIVLLVTNGFLIFFEIYEINAS